jgi:hypothetical protein
MKEILLLISLFLLGSCASTMPGTDLNLKSSFLGGTIKENEDLSNERFKTYQVSIKNYSQDWITIGTALMSNTKKTNIIIGDRAEAWFEACRLEKRVSDYNMSLALGALGVTGAVVGGTSHNATTSAVGSAVALGSIGALGAKEFMESRNKVEFQKALPDGHLFKGFVIPPMKVAQRWLLVERVSGETPVITLISADEKIGEVSFELP